MSLKLKLGAVVLIILISFIGVLGGSRWNIQQLENIATRRRTGQVLLATGNRLEYGRLALQASMLEGAAVSSQLLDDIFIMHTDRVDYSN